MMDCNPSTPMMRMKMPVMSDMAAMKNMAECGMNVSMMAVPMEAWTKSCDAEGMRCGQMLCMSMCMKKMETGCQPMMLGQDWSCTYNGQAMKEPFSMTLMCDNKPMMMMGLNKPVMMDVSMMAMMCMMPNSCKADAAMMKACGFASCPDECCCTMKKNTQMCLGREITMMMNGKPETLKGCMQVCDSTGKVMMSFMEGQPVCMNKAMLSCFSNNCCCCVVDGSTCYMCTCNGKCMMLSCSMAMKMMQMTCNMPSLMEMLTMTMDESCCMQCCKCGMAMMQDTSCMCMCLREDGKPMICGKDVKFFMDDQMMMMNDSTMMLMCGNSVQMVVRQHQPLMVSLQMMCDMCPCPPPMKMPTMSASMAMACPTPMMDDMMMMCRSGSEMMMGKECVMMVDDKPMKMKGSCCMVVSDSSGPCCMMMMEEGKPVMCNKRLMMKMSCDACCMCMTSDKKFCMAATMCMPREMCLSAMRDMNCSMCPALCLPGTRMDCDSLSKMCCLTSDCASACCATKSCPKCMKCMEMCPMLMMMNENNSECMVLGKQMRWMAVGGKEVEMKAPCMLMCDNMCMMMTCAASPMMCSVEMMARMMPLPKDATLSNEAMSMKMKPEQCVMLMNKDGKTPCVFGPDMRMFPAMNVAGAMCLMDDTGCCMMMLEEGKPVIMRMEMMKRMSSQASCMIVTNMPDGTPCMTSCCVNNSPMMVPSAACCSMCDMKEKCMSMMMEGFKACDASCCMDCDNCKMMMQAMKMPKTELCMMCPLVDSCGQPMICGKDVMMKMDGKDMPENCESCCIQMGGKVMMMMCPGQPVMVNVQMMRDMCPCPKECASDCPAPGCMTMCHSGKPVMMGEPTSMIAGAMMLCMNGKPCAMPCEKIMCVDKSGACLFQMGKKKPLVMTPKCLEMCSADCCMCIASPTGVKPLCIRGNMMCMSRECATMCCSLMGTCCMADCAMANMACCSMQTMCQETMDTAGCPKISYFGVCGRAEFIKMMMEEAGEKYKFHEVPFGKHQAEMGDKLPFGQLPLYEENGFMLAQTGTILRFLARKYNMMPFDMYDAARCEMVVDGCLDFMGKYFACSIYKTMAPQMYMKECNTWAGYFERLMMQCCQGKKFVCERFSYADCCLFQCLDVMETSCPGTLCNFPALQGFYNRMMQRPNIRAFMMSSRHMHPMKCSC